MSPDNTRVAAKKPLPKPKPGTPAKPAPAAAAPKRYLAMLRADFYYDRYYALLIFCLILMSMIGIMVLAGLYERTIKPTPEFFPTTLDGKLVAPIPLSQPGISTPALLEWAVEAIITSYTFNFVDYEKVISDASIYYTQAGYQDYRKALIESNTVGSVQRRKYVLSAVPTYAPIILKESAISDGTWSWQVQFPMILTFQNIKEVIKKDMIVTMLIVRVPITESPTGIAITAIIVREGILAK